MQNQIINVVADKLLRDAQGDPSALTPAQRAEREGMNDLERFDEFTGPMPTHLPNGEWMPDRRDHAGSVDISRPAMFTIRQPAD